ncbi:MAG: hypothetical protein ACI9WC_001102 [Arenicella sp.]|jgi:hypothetical protein
MAKNTLNCYVFPAVPLPFLLPKECVADIVEKPDVVQLEAARANWMKGHVIWNNQLISVLSYSALHDAQLDESEKRNPVLVVLNPIPDAARKAFVGVLCFGKVEEIAVSDNIEQLQTPENIDQRYIETAVSIGKHKYLIPKLAAMGVAYSYF